jgi:hypothetical protein
VGVFFIVFIVCCIIFKSFIKIFKLKSFKKDIESIESMYKYLIKESPVKERPDLLFLGELHNDNNFVGKMGHLVNISYFCVNDVINYHLFS